MLKVHGIEQMKEEGYDQNNGFYIKLSIHLVLK